MRCSRISCWCLVLGLATFATGCSYVHFGRPERFRTNAGLREENADLRVEKKLLQQELALARKEGDALRAVLDRPQEGAEELVSRLNETTRELAELRANYTRLRAERESLPPAESSGADAVDREQAARLQRQLGETEDKLAETLRSFTTLQEENTRLRASIDQARAENASLTLRVERVTAQNTEARSALAELNTELLAQKTARAEAEQQAQALRAQLVAMANAVPQDDTPSLAAARESSAAGAREIDATLHAPLVSGESSASAMLSIDSARLRQAAAPAAEPTSPPTAVAAPTLATTPPPPAAAEPAPAAKPARTYVVQAGDTLEKISQKVYGRPDRWNRLFEANNGLLSERPLGPGMELVVPDL